MTNKELKIILESTNLPVYYYAPSVSGKNKLTPPCIVYYAQQSDNIGADNKVAVKFKNYTIELYTTKKDSSMEQKIENVLDDAGIFYNSYESYIDDDSMFQIAYEIEI
jgi:hypothetical protein